MAAVRETEVTLPRSRARLSRPADQALTYECIAAYACFRMSIQAARLPSSLLLSDLATIQPSIANHGRPRAVAPLMHGQILRRLRETKGRSQADVARSAGISPAQLARLEANQRGLYVEDFVNIAAVLGEKPGNLLPNDLGDIAHLKPIIDRLAAVRPEVLPHVAAIIEGIVSLTEDSAELPSQKQRKRPHQQQVNQHPEDQSRSDAM
jgi:transcriptional regulator with XRE-family HTH domain